MLHQLHAAYRRTPLSTRLRQRRYARIESALGMRAGERVLEVGCAQGIDFAQFAAPRFRISGIDLAEVQRVCEFDFRVACATALPFADRSFDHAVSIGVFEHIQPLDRLCAASLEIARVARRFCVVVPANGTPIEPHQWSPLWQLRDRNAKPASVHALNYLSDEAWLQLPGFLGARSTRFWHAPGFLNLMIVGG